MRSRGAIPAALSLLVTLAGPAGAAAPGGLPLPYESASLPTTDYWGTAIRLVVSLLLVVGMVVGSQRLLRRLSPGGGSGSGAVRVREVHRLAHNHSLYVVEAGGRRLLLGSGLAVIADIGAADDLPTGAPFATRLRAATERLGQLSGRQR